MQESIEGRGEFDNISFETCYKQVVEFLKNKKKRKNTQDARESEAENQIKELEGQEKDLIVYFVKTFKKIKFLIFELSIGKKSNFNGGFLVFLTWCLGQTHLSSGPSIFL